MSCWARAAAITGRRKRKRRKENKGQIHLQSCCLLRRGPGWRWKPARLTETKLQVQREVIRKPPSGSMLPFKFHLIKPKEKKPLSLLSFPGAPLLLTPSGPPLPALLSPLPGLEGNIPLHPLSFSCLLQRPRHPDLSSLNQWVPSLSPSSSDVHQGPLSRGQAQMGSKTGSHLPWGLGARNKDSQHRFAPTKESLSPPHCPLPNGQKRYQKAMQTPMPGAGAVYIHR